MTTRRDLTAETAEDKTDIEAEARALGVDAYKLRANKAVGDRLVRDIVSDLRAPISQSTSLIGRRRESPPTKGSGWVDAAPVTPTGGIGLIDKMVEAQSRVDKLAAIKQRLEADWIEQQLLNDDEGDE